MSTVSTVLSRSPYFIGFLDHAGRWTSSPPLSTVSTEREPVVPQHLQSWRVGPCPRSGSLCRCITHDQRSTGGSLRSRRER